VAITGVGLVTRGRIHPRMHVGEEYGMFYLEQAYGLSDAFRGGATCAPMCWASEKRGRTGHSRVPTIL
jgi:hypothetical protein